MTEILVALVVVMILVTLSVPLYRGYSIQAAVAEIEFEYEALKERVELDLQQGEVSRCSELYGELEKGLVNDVSARLSMDFQAVNNDPLQGYRPVLHVCARQDTQGGFAVRTAKAVHDYYAGANQVDANAVVLSSLVHFSLPLTVGTGAACRVPAGADTTPCGDPIAIPTPSPVSQTQPKTPPLAPQSTPTPQTVQVPRQLAPMDETVSTDFSNPPMDPNQNSGVWHRVDPKVWGWATDNPDGTVEHGSGSAYGDTSGGNVGIIELEGAVGEPSNLYREIATRPGARYKFSFDLSGRVGVSSQSAGVEILWEGKVIDTLYPPANRFGFAAHEYQLTATGTGSKIELRAVTQDGSGPVVDNLNMQYQGGG